MKKLLLFSLLWMCPLSAYFYSEPGDLGFMAEWIYFQPKFDDQYFVAVDDQPGGNSDATRVKNNPHYHSGFRAAVFYSFCDGCTDIYVRYTHLREHYEKTLRAPGAAIGTNIEALFPTVGNLSVLAQFNGTGAIPFAYANADGSFHYDAGDALISRKLFQWSDLAFDLHAGAHYAQLSNKNIYTFITDPTFAQPNAFFGVEEKMRFWGVGPEIGFDLNYSLFCNLSIVGRATTALLVGRSHSVSVSETTVNGLNFVSLTNDPDWRFVPTQNYRLGLNYYLHCMSCIRLNFEIGYELITYFRAFNTIYERQGTAANERILLSFDTFNDVSMNGPYASLTISF